MTRHVTVETPEEGVALVTLDRPGALNALTVDVTEQLAEALDRIAADRSVRVVILTGAGRAFCAGLDLNGFGDDDRIEVEGRVGRTMTRQVEIAGLSQRLRDLPQPVIAAVNGPAAGAGLALVCASDVRVAAESAVFAVSFITAGYSACDLGVSWLLPRIMGAGRAHELMLTGRRFGPDEALAGGLVARIVPSAELIESALATARLILANAPLSVEMTKQGMWTALETPSFDASVEYENRQQVFTAMTDDQSEATAAFLGKRPAAFRRR
ncbi:enoyl-CoA hydratase/isomerase family protein [Aeromicrobium sp. CFBP 8757]|uniref:enoyl-CoA hydratase/isomerase family protein n=1 Tax=Aeromicrobium sp. CFBP 8757 TaxID=2775288 RepID=UPI001781B649|nr:enoyl-CoA hydratase/isomerase family protein [Aeromicrobium sp. CFBP 8757]MBD8605453.1 enoyl-CoA hydratase/isomerase family protein [Aeromicrobium sp. CFBP 8757]